LGASKGSAHSPGFYVAIVLPVLAVALVIATAIIIVLRRRRQLLAARQRPHELTGDGTYELVEEGRHELVEEGRHELKGEGRHELKGDSRYELMGSATYDDRKPDEGDVQPVELPNNERPLESSHTPAENEEQKQENPGSDDVP